MPETESRDELRALLDNAEESIAAGDRSGARLALDAALAIAPGDSDALTLDELLRATVPPFPEPGRPGRFTGSRFIGRGFHKDVWYAYDTLFARPVAIGNVRLDGNPGARQRAIEEVRATGRIGAHANLVALYEAVDDDDQFILVEEYLSGGTLADLLDSQPSRRLEPARVVEIGLDLCRALSVVHRQRFVHGDVKPRNVFLDETGVVKLGDLGSALSLDRTEALAAMGMVGTALYLAPEHALGGSIGPWSDLYSLGAVLYEMVTGRPPFLGDEATRVIAQHVKDRPVAPSWHSDACSAALEDLILRLLEKDASQRYDSAESTAEALEAALSVDGGPRARERELPLESMAPGAFVGRDVESAALYDAYRRAEGGTGSVAFIAGEAGMGKSRLVEQLMVFARVHGGQVLTGRSRESPGAPACWPWIEVGRTFVSEAGVQPIRELGPAARELGRMFAALRELLPDVPPPDDESDPEAARTSLFGAYAAVVSNAAATQPTLIVLEDLHTADEASIALLEYLARRAGRQQLLIVATFRPADDPEASPLRSLQRLAQRDESLLLRLKPLNEDEVGAYLHQAAGVASPRHVVAEIWRRTDGNPFFLVEVVNHMVETGQLFSPRWFSLPGSISAALEFRLEMLSAGTATLMRTAAVFGRDFRAAHLAALQGTPPDAIAPALNEATNARIIEATEDAGRFRFVHALMREALVDQLGTDAASRLNGRAGDVLEEMWGGRSDERASRLAEHFFAAVASDTAYRERAIRYLELAAGQARETLSWAEAARHYRRCIVLVEDAGWHDRVAPLLESHGICARNSGAMSPAWASLTSAVDQYAASGDVLSAARATLAAMSIPSEGRGDLALRALDLVRESAPETEGMLLTHRLRLRGLSPADRESLELKLEQLVAAHPTADFVAHAKALAAARALERGDLDAAETLAGQAFSLLDGQAEREPAAVALLLVAMAHTQAGNLELAREAYASFMHYAATARLHYMAGVGAMALAGLHRMRCEFELYEQMLGLIPSDNWTRQIFAAERAEHAGEGERCVTLLPSTAVAAGVPEWEMILHGSRARMLYNARGPAAAEADFEEWRKTLAALTANTDQSLVESISSATPLETALGLADECFIALGSDAETEQMYQRLVAHSWMRTAGDFRQLDRVRGALALRLGRDQEAAEHFRVALEWCERERCPIEAGRCLQGLAEVAVRAGDTVGALALLNRAALSFSGYETQLFLGQVLAAKLRLQGVLGLDPESSIDLADSAGARLLAADLAMPGATDVTIVFTDIDESTAIAERLGDAAWVGLLRAHNAIVRAEIARFGGREVKTIGDAFMVAFPTPQEALRFAVSLQHAMAARNSRAETAIRVTVGVHTGRAINEHGDFIGLDVVVASRVCSWCPPDQIAATESVRQAVASDDEFVLAAQGHHALKGISSRQALYMVAWNGR